MLVNSYKDCMHVIGKWHSSIVESSYDSACGISNTYRMNNLASNATNWCIGDDIAGAIRLINGAFAVLGSVGSIATISMVLLTRKRRLCFMRLILYLSIASLLSSVVGGLQMVDPAKTLWKSVCQSLGFLSNYFAYCKSCFSFAICADIYVFALSNKRARLQRHRSEAVVIAMATLIVPPALSWECWNDSDWCSAAGNCTRLMATPGKGALCVALASAPHIVLYAMSAGMVATVVGLLCRKALRSHIWHLSRAKVVTVSPLLLYTCFLCVAHTVALIMTSSSTSFNAKESAEGLTAVSILFSVSNAFFLPLMLRHDHGDLLISRESHVVPHGAANNNWQYDSVDSGTSARSVSYADKSDEVHERSLLCTKSDMKPSAPV